MAAYRRRYAIPWIDFRTAQGRGESRPEPAGADFSVAWLQNPRRGGGNWRLHVVDRELNGIHGLHAADVNGDGRVDVVGACGHGKGVVWYAGPAWTRHVIDADIANPHALALGDFDGDGDTDAAVASCTAFIVRWYENDGRGNFTAHDIDTGNRQQAYDLKAADLDGAGRTDLVVAGRESKNAVVYFNRDREQRRPR